jgi:hypothetical protein
MSNETQTQNAKTKTEPRIELPKTELPKPESPPEMPKSELPFPGNLFASFDPMQYWTASQQAFQKAMADAQTRAQAFADQCATVESQVTARAQGAVASWAQLAQDAIAYTAQLSAEARKLGLETARKLGVRA